MKSQYSRDFASHTYYRQPILCLARPGHDIPLMVTASNVSEPDLPQQMLAGRWLRGTTVIYISNTAHVALIRIPKD